jgi:rSAM/selenodomain-associated transferase 2
MPSVSIIVPVWRDTASLASLLEQLLRQSLAPQEVIVVDGDAGSGEDVATLCALHTAVYLRCLAGRGAQLNAGARRARGDVLWFVHADAGLQPGSLQAVADAVAAGARGGYFRFRFAGPRSLTRALLERCIGWRCKVGAVYGDQAIFAARQAWLQAGGFAEQPLFEEVRLVRALKRMGEFVALPIDIEVSARRWERDGWWRRTVMNRLLALGYILGVPPKRLAHWYRQL